MTSSRCASKSVAIKIQLKSKIIVELRIKVLSYFWISITNFVNILCVYYSLIRNNSLCIFFYTRCTVRFEVYVVRSSTNYLLSWLKILNLH